MSRENVDDRARRYLTEGRVVITAAGPGHVDARVRGDGAIWTVAYRRGGWSCDCPSRGRCAHLIAVGCVTAPTSIRYAGDRPNLVGIPTSPDPGTSPGSPDEHFPEVA